VFLRRDFARELTKPKILDIMFIIGILTIEGRRGNA